MLRGDFDGGVDGGYDGGSEIPSCVELADGELLLLLVFYITDKGKFGIGHTVVSYRFPGSVFVLWFPENMPAAAGLNA